MRVGPDETGHPSAQSARKHARGVSPRSEAGRWQSSPNRHTRGGDHRGGSGDGINAQLCGDAHLSNLGVYGAPDRSMVFDINDFDETLGGP